MNIDQARQLLNEIEALLYSGSTLEFVVRTISNEIRVSAVDGAFHEALAKLHALGAFDANLNEFISKFIRHQIHRFYNELYKNRKWHLIHGHVYVYSDVLHFIEESQKLIYLLREKIEQIHEESCEETAKFITYVMNQTNYAD